MKLNVLLLKSDNSYLPYPCKGELDVTEVGTNGRVIVAVFRKEKRDEQGHLFAPVVVKNPVFVYGDVTEYWLYELTKDEGIFQGTCGPDAESIMRQVAGGIDNAGAPFRAFSVTDNC